MDFEKMRDDALDMVNETINHIISVKEKGQFSVMWCYVDEAHAQITLCLRIGLINNDTFSILWDRISNVSSLTS